MLNKRDMAMNRLFRCFCKNRFGMGPLQYHSSHFYFGFEFAEIFIFEKRLPAINDTGSRRLRVSLIASPDRLPVAMSL